MLEQVHKASMSRFAKIIKSNHNTQNARRQKRPFTEQCNQVPTASGILPSRRVEEQTTMHLYSCPNENMQDILDNAVRELEDLIQQRYILENVWRAMVLDMRTAKDNSDPTD